MTRRRDRYQSAFDWGDPRGVSAASYDLMLALALLDRYITSCGLRTQKVCIGVRSECIYTLDELLDIAETARRQSIDPALNIYQQLQVNAEAASALSAACTTPKNVEKWTAVRDAFADTLDKRLIARRGFVNAAKRLVAVSAQIREAKRGDQGGDQGGQP